MHGQGVVLQISCGLDSANSTKRSDDAREALDIMNYGVGRRILAGCLYEKLADLIINQKLPEKQAPAHYEEAFQLYPNLDLVMAYEGSHATSKALVQLLKAKGISIDARAEDGLDRVDNRIKYRPHRCSQTLAFI